MTRGQGVSLQGPQGLSRRSAAAYREHSDEDIHSIIRRVERENRWLPHGFLAATANLESGHRGAGQGREFGPGALGRSLPSGQRAIGLTQILTTPEGRQVGQGNRGPTAQQLLDPETNIRAWLPLAQRALATARAHEPELRRMGRSVEAGARMLLYGMSSPTARRLSLRGAGGQPARRLTEEETNKLVQKWEARFRHYRERP